MMDCSAFFGLVFFMTHIVGVKVTNAEGSYSYSYLCTYSCTVPSLSLSALISSLADISACSGENVTLTCVVLDTGSLIWVIGSSNNTLVFELLDDSYLTTQTDSTGQFTASLMHYSRDKDCLC